MYLNGVLQEEVFVKQPLDMRDPNHSNYVYRLPKAIYGLKQPSRAWYDTLQTIEFVMSCANTSLFVLRH